jgi:hypothetical protein
MVSRFRYPIILDHLPLTLHLALSFLGGCLVKYDQPLPFPEVPAAPGGNNIKSG